MKVLKVGAVIFGAVIITALGIDAADTLSGNNGSMLGQLIATEEGACPEGMTEMSTGQTFSCVDTYEASASEACAVSTLRSSKDTQDNLNVTTCTAHSAEKISPWTHVTREQAQVLCARAGKRLPTAQEWHTIAMGTPDTQACNIMSDTLALTGAYKDCVSAVGTHDAVGNVWEWTSDDIIEGQYDGHLLPEEGYVTQVTADGVAILTDTAPSEQFMEDYIWTSHIGVFGLMRGGFYGSGTDGGVYAVQAETPPTAATVAIGFRCVK